MNAFDHLRVPGGEGEAEHPLLVLGVGSAGGRMLECVWRQGLTGACFVALNTDQEALQRCAVPTKVQLGARRTRGLGAGGDPQVGREAAEECEGVLRELVVRNKLVFLLTGLGGGTGTGSAPVVARVAREAGALVVCLATLPFECEGARRGEQARRGMEALREVADAVLCLPNQQVLRILDESTSLVETFRFTENLVAESVSGLWRLLREPGLIPVDFADLCRVVKDRHTESYFAHAMGHGELRVREVIDRIRSSPLMDGGGRLRTAESLLVGVVAGPDLTMAEINRVAEGLRRECEGAEIVLGANVDTTLGDGMAVTVISTQRRPAGTAPAAAETPALPTVAKDRLLGATGDDLETDFFRRNPPSPRPPSKFVAPPPELTEEQRHQLLDRQSQRIGRGRTKMRQTLLPLEILSKGRFEKSEPTLYRGEDLDVPTFIRRGVVLN